jgi:hypothetical protein
MKTNLYLPLLFLSTILFTSCEKDWLDVVKGSGPVVSETRSVASFDDIELNIPAEVYIIQGENESITIDAQANVLDVVETNVNRHELKIKFSNGVVVKRYETIRVYITTNELTEISVSGSGSVYNDSPIITNELRLRISGSGKVDLYDVDASIIDSKISGSGNVYLTGVCDDQFISISGSGDIKAFDMISENTEVDISGSGKGEVRVNNLLKARISGSGKVYYKGYPHHIDSKISGSGGVYHVD